MRRLLKKFEVGGRRLLFRSLSPGAASDVTLARLPEGEEPGRIMLLRQDRIGDMIMTLPLVRELRRLHPHARVCVVCSEDNEIILKHEPDLHLIVYRKNPLAFLRSLAMAAEFAPDAAVDLHMHDSTTSLLYSMVSGSRWRLHIDRDNRLPFNVRVRAPQDGHIMEAFSGLLSGLGRDLTLEDLDRRVILSGEELEFGKDFWDRCSFAPADTAAVNISAGGDNRSWSREKYSAVCSDLLAMGLHPLIISSPGDRQKARDIARSSEGILEGPETPTILHLASVIDGVVLLVSPDTSVVHLAASCGVPVVGMYLPFDPTLPKWYPWEVRSEVVMSDDDGDLSSIEPLAVSNAVRRLLSSMIGEPELTML